VVKPKRYSELISFNKGFPKHSNGKSAGLFSGMIWKKKGPGEIICLLCSVAAVHAAEKENYLKTNYL
jgi:hypothetical protein